MRAHLATIALLLMALGPLARSQPVGKMDSNTPKPYNSSNSYDYSDIVIMGSDRYLCVKFKTCPANTPLATKSAWVLLDASLTISLLNDNYDTETNDYKKNGIKPMFMGQKWECVTTQTDCDNPEKNPFTDAGKICWKPDGGAGTG